MSNARLSRASSPVAKPRALRLRIVTLHAAFEQDADASLFQGFQVAHDTRPLQRRPIAFDRHMAGTHDQPGVPNVASFSSTRSLVTTIDRMSAAEHRSRERPQEPRQH